MKRAMKRLKLENKILRWLNLDPRKEISPEDIKLAIKIKANEAFTTGNYDNPLPSKLITGIAEQFYFDLDLKQPSFPLNYDSPKLKR